ncbi:hypothetical protein DPSP01_006235 [Paraphaeosphaeria sporulosa]|uniref:Uncharacterized protein n=1 Tax=Paraphaeosphaeria sporulosa TaxID=1460663 RepID=A0A177BZE9_9PLEO|nr:uncharacterized protein CC84DRAFT_350862 [Paraphaeosphaeria sporulosa]OAF99961.1 hypothetical protein CC84DRAFT_350862 [Paraphaeosphaeria sporulosa]
MCFYDMHRFACGDWKWGNFRQHCAKEYRMGETCGMKLVNHTIHVPQKCKICEKVECKQRKRAAEVDRIHRWQREGNKFRASIDKSMDAIANIDVEIRNLNYEMARRRQQIGAQACT